MWARALVGAAARENAEVRCGATGDGHHDRDHYEFTHRNCPFDLSSPNQQIKNPNSPSHDITKSIVVPH
jgi:hypothetical protein